MELQSCIPLSGLLGDGKFAIVDDNYALQFVSDSWHLTKGGYAKCGKYGLMHRHVVTLRGENVEGFMVDHINGDRLDNRSSNLRTVTAKGNAKNKHTDPTHEKLVGVRRGANGFETVHQNVVCYEHENPKMCALCYDSVVWYCYGRGKRLNDNTSNEPYPIQYWNLTDHVMQKLLKIKTSYTDFKGVKKVKNGWKATIVVELGIFETPEDAARAYNRALRTVKIDPKLEEFNDV